MKALIISIMIVVNLSVDGLVAMLLYHLHPLLGAAMAVFAVASSAAFPIVLDRVASWNARFSEPDDDPDDDLDD